MLRGGFLRVAFLIAVVCLFAVSSVVSYQRHSESSNILAITLKTTAWSASELESEMLKFVHTLELFQLDKRSVDDLVLRFDLLWSRINVLKAGDESAELRGLPGVSQLLSSLERVLQDNEQAVMQIKPGDHQTAAALQAQFRVFQPALRALNVDNFSGPRRLRELEEALGLQQSFGVYLLGLLLSGALLVVLVLRESARNRLQALHDPLTGLPNRKYFNDHLRIAESRSRRGHLRMAIHVIDLNDFKGINDTFGHNAGDQLLIEIARRLKACVRQQDIVARLGGDEFAVIQEEVPHAEVCGQLARRICEQVGQPLRLGANQVFPAASIGVSIYPDDSGDVTQLLVNADIAMYRAKRDGGVSYRFFEAQMNAAIMRRKRLADDLRVALDQGQMMLFYQPIVDLDSGLIAAVEALLRWHHPSYGYVPPPEVVSIAEQFALTKPLNEWVLQQACQQHQQWRAQGLPVVAMNVNISPAMYTQHDLVATVQSVLKRTGMAAQQLVLEVTEDTTMHDIESSPDILNRLRQQGVSLALDDFGTGYSSLSHLRKMPVQKLKIDKSFVQDLNNEPKDLRFIRTIIRLAHNLELEVVAEGIEVEENLRDLMAEGCHYVQGYLLSRPQQAADIGLMLEQQQRGNTLMPETGVIRQQAGGAV